MLADQEAIVREIARIDSTINAVENELYQTKNQSRQDPLNFPIKLTNKLAHLNSLTNRGEFPPTDQAIAVRDELSAKIDEQLAIFYDIRDNALPGLNQMIRDSEADYIILQKE